MPPSLLPIQKTDFYCNAFIYDANVRQAHTACRTKHYSDCINPDLTFIILLLPPAKPCAPLPKLPLLLQIHPYS